MKKLITLLSAACIFAGSVATTGFTVKSDEENMVKGCKSAYLIEAQSGECMYKENEFTRMPIASVCNRHTLEFILLKYTLSGIIINKICRLTTLRKLTVGRLNFKSRRRNTARNQSSGA